MAGSLISDKQDCPRNLSPSGGRFIERWYLLLPLCLAFSFVMLYHWIVPLGALPFTAGVKGQDSAQMVWNLWFANESITHGRNPYHSDQLFYPVGSGLGHHTLAPGFFPITFLVKTAMRGDPRYPFYAYQIIILLSFTLLLYLSYLLLRELGFSPLPSAAAAVAYAFSDFYILHVLHINHLAGFFFPLTGLLLARFFKRPDSLNLVAVALVAALSVYFTEFAVYLYMAALLFAIMMWSFKSERSALLATIRKAGWARLGIATATFVLIISPFLIVLFRDKIRKPGYVEITSYSANLAGFFIPGQQREESEVFGTAYMTPLYGTLFRPLDSKVTAGLGGFEIFVGYPLLLFTIFTLVKSRRRLAMMCLVSAVFFFVLSLGPTLKVFATDTGIKLPYAVLMKVPPFDSGRTPVRFVSIGLFFLMIVGAHGMSSLEGILKRRAGTRWANAALGLVLVWTLAEVYSPAAPRKPFRTPAALENLAAGPVFNLPPVQWDGYAAMLQTQHHRPISAGYLARNSEALWEYNRDQFHAFSKGGAYFCSYVRGLGFRNIVIAPPRMTAPHHFSLEPLQLDKCAINVVDLRGEEASSPDQIGATFYEAEQPNEFPLLPPGKLIGFGKEEADPYLWYGWSGREAFSHWTDRGQVAIVFALGEVRAATLRLDMAPFLAPPNLNSQRIRIKLNGQLVADLTMDSPETREYPIALPPDIVRQKNIVTFDLPDAETPERLGLSPDRRLLGINVQQMVLDPKKP